MVALIETAHILRTQYGVDRGAVIDVLIEFLTRENVELLGLPTDRALSALVRARSLPGSPIPDALIVATAGWACALPVFTFDRERCTRGGGGHSVMPLDCDCR